MTEDAGDPMTPAVPDPTVEALAEVIRKTGDKHYINDMTAEQDEQRDAFMAALATVLAPILAEHTERAVREALEAAADELDWVRPDVCPCANPEACCGSEESCDAMQPSVKVVGADWLRARAEQIGGRP